MKKCPYCRHENNEQAKVCEKCCAELPVNQEEKEPKKVQKQEVKKHGT